jgi:hypothetical protein
MMFMWVSLLGLMSVALATGAVDDEGTPHLTALMPGELILIPTHKMRRRNVLIN